MTFSDFMLKFSYFIETSFEFYSISNKLKGNEDKINKN